MRLLAMLLLVVFVMGAPEVRAACTLPSGAGVEGEIIYNRAYKVMQYCDGTGWRSMTGGGGVEGVSEAAGDAAGQLQFRAADGAFSADSLLGFDVSNKRLMVGGNLSDARISVQGDGTTNWKNAAIALRNTGTSGRVYSLASRENGVFSIADETSGHLRFRILNDGRFVIGTGAVTSYTVSVTGSVNTTGNIRMEGTDFEIYNATRCGSSCGGRGRALVHDGGDVLVVNYATDFAGGTRVEGDLRVGGEAYKPGGGVWTASSDARLKDIKGDYERGLEDVLALRPVMFEYKAGNPRGEPEGKVFVGMVAQDVQGFFPEAVKKEKDGYLSLDMTPIHYAYINAIKALSDKNTALEARIKALEEAKAGQ